MAEAWVRLGSWAFVALIWLALLPVREARLPRPDDGEVKLQCTGSCRMAASNSKMMKTMRHKIQKRQKCESEGLCPLPRAKSSSVPCGADGKSGEYPCNDVDMLSFVPLSDMGGSRGANDIWGWTDTLSGREYALVGLVGATAFVDLTVPLFPRVLGLMLTQTHPSIWRDLKVYKNHVYVVSEAGDHGMQIFDLTRLRAAAERPEDFLRSGEIRSLEQFSGMCLEASERTFQGGKIDLVKCGKSKRAQQWKFDSVSKQLWNRYGLCLDVPNATDPVQASPELSMQPCDEESVTQRWAYDDRTGQLQHVEDMCLGASSVSNQTQVLLKPCSPDDASQRWQAGQKSVDVYEPDAWYGEVGSSHNIAINEQTGVAYLLGTKTCKGGLHMVDLSTPKEPSFLGCFADDGYTHDSQCVIYSGPDAKYQGREICFNYNEDTLTIVDVKNHSMPKLISRVGYNNSYYTHQGWLDEKQEFLFMDDELDEMSYDPDDAEGPSNHTRTMIWDIRDLANPTLVGNFYSEETSIDHNLYVDGSVIFQSNYCAGLRILEIAKEDSLDVGEQLPQLKEIGYFDIDPDCSLPEFAGTWSNYPYYASGIVAVTSVERGLFILRPRLTNRKDLMQSRARAHFRRRAQGISS